MSTGKHWGACLRATAVIILVLAILFGVMGAIDGGSRAAFYGVLGGVSIGVILGVFYAVILLLFAWTDK